MLMNRFYVKYFVGKYFYTKFANQYMKFAANNIKYNQPKLRNQCLINHTVKSA